MKQVESLAFLNQNWKLISRLLKPEPHRMDLDNILEQIGEFGKFQIQNYLLVCLPVIFSAANSLTYVFTAAIPKYRWVYTKYGCLRV